MPHEPRSFLARLVERWLVWRLITCACARSGRLPSLLDIRQARLLLMELRRPSRSRDEDDARACQVFLSPSDKPE